MNIYKLDDDILADLRHYMRNIEWEPLENTKIPAWNRGIPNSPETRRLCGLAAKRKVITDEMRENYRQSKLGEKNPNYGKKLNRTESHCESISKWQKEKEDHHAKKVVMCPHCNKNGKFVIMQRWHFNNCKFKT